MLCSFDLVDSGNRCILSVSAQIVGVSFFWFHRSQIYVCISTEEKSNYRSISVIIISWYELLHSLLVSGPLPGLELENLKNKLFLDKACIDYFLILSVLENSENLMKEKNPLLEEFTFSHTYKMEHDFKRFTNLLKPQRTLEESVHRGQKPWSIQLKTKWKNCLLKLDSDSCLLILAVLLGRSE